VKGILFGIFPAARLPQFSRRRCRKRKIKNNFSLK
jgi:hypothetical protein